LGFPSEATLNRLHIQFNDVSNQGKSEA